VIENIEDFFCVIRDWIRKWLKTLGVALAPLPIQTIGTQKARHPYPYLFSTTV
jgi:hypothetical protein